jgi:ATP-dependent RNA helicase RhlE
LYYVEKGDKTALLTHLLEGPEISHVLVFTRTKHGADKVAKTLTKSGIKAEAIHGNKSQTARQKALKGFKERAIKVLIATDIASRGIDVDKLSHVINYELPEVPETYVHRIGRTGRAGALGKALSFCSSDERSQLRQITKLIKKDIVVVEDHPYVSTVPQHSRSNDGRGNGGGRPAKDFKRRPTSFRKNRGHVSF